jgi:hypothetical protein
MHEVGAQLSGIEFTSSGGFVDTSGPAARRRNGKVAKPDVLATFSLNPMKEPMFTLNAITPGVSVKLASRMRRRVVEV